MQTSSDQNDCPIEAPAEVRLAIRQMVREEAEALRAEKMAALPPPLAEAYANHESCLLMASMLNNAVAQQWHVINDAAAKLRKLGQAVLQLQKPQQEKESGGG